MRAAIAAENLTVSYDDFLALDDVSIDVASGESALIPFALNAA